MKTFENKTVLITGGTSGIGKAAALAFAKEGANVVVSGRRVAEGEEVSREITSAGGSALFVRADVSREDDIVALVEKSVGAFGALHIAFNNAGIEGKFGLLTTEQTVEHYDQVCDINIRGVLLSMKHEIPAMLRSGGGAIVNNSSIGGHIGFNGSSVYVAAAALLITSRLKRPRAALRCPGLHNRRHRARIPIALRSCGTRFSYFRVPLGYP
jgi:NAD(P)-dependent dehydrogenase (short-subunit alcohol dehydrogenase family)